MHPPSRDTIIKYVRSYGGMSTDAVLDPKTEIFTSNGIEGLIGYKLSYKTAVVYGDPVCDINNQIKLAKEFHKFCHSKQYKVIYMAASSYFKQLAIESNLCKCHIQYGEELFIDPKIDPQSKSGNYASLLRRKVRHAIKEGLTVEEFTSNDEKTKLEIEDVGQLWLKNRKGAQIHISNVYLFDDSAGKRWFYAKKDNKIVGCAVINRLDARQGWLLNHLMVTPESSGGTAELMVCTILKTLANENCPYISFSIVPNSKLSDLKGFGPIGSFIAKSSYNIAKKIFNFDRLMKFWEKFDPELTPSYLLFAESKISLKDIMSIMKATNASF